MERDGLQARLGFIAAGQIGDQSDQRAQQREREQRERKSERTRSVLADAGEQSPRATFREALSQPMSPVEAKREMSARP